MRKRPIKPFTDTITELTERLIRENTEPSLINLSPAICMECGDAWLLRKTEDSQFSHVHARHQGQRYNIRVSIERIGATNDERAELSRAYRAVVK